MSVSIVLGEVSSGLRYRRDAAPLWTGRSAARGCGERPVEGAYDLPYTGTTAPRVTLLSGEARNRIVAATSSTFGHFA